MMKKLFVYLLAMVSLASCTCEKAKDKDKDKPPRKVHHIFILDHVDDQVIDQFKAYLMDVIPGNSFSIDHVQPKGFEEIAFSVYGSWMNDGDMPVKILFKNTTGDAASRHERTDRFIERLGKLPRRFNNHNLLHILARVFSAASEPDVEYHVFMVSDMIERSGDLQAGDRKKDWVEGHFRFVNLDGDCISDDVTEANRQLSDTTSWTYQYLLQKSSINTSVARNIKVLIYKIPTDIHSNGTPGCSAKTIHDYWNSLFEKMEIAHSFNEDGALFDTFDPYQ